MKALRNICWATLCVVALGVVPVQAQQQSQNQQQSSDQAAAPIPAYRSPLASAADNGDSDSANDNSDQLAPDNRSLAGAQNLSLGEPTTRSYWQPHFDLSASADSNPLEATNETSWGAWTSVSGGVDVHRISGNSNMTLSYTSSGMLSSESNVPNGIVQGLSFADKFSFRRAAISFFDQLNYLPESALGFGGLGGAAGNGPTGLGAGFAQGQSLLVGRGQNLGNSFVTQVDTYLTPRTSLTFVGGYSLLHYFDSDLFNYGDVSFRGGYNYEATRKDTIAVLYTFSGFRFSNADQSISTHTVQASYGRRVTGRLAFQIAAGPQVVFSRMPITGGGGASGGGGDTGSTASSVTQVFWSLNTSLLWQAQRNMFGLTYSHGAGGGSGVLAGALTDVVTGSMTRQVSRTFSSGIQGGYTRNQGLTLGTLTPFNQKYDYWFAGGSLTHPLGRTLGVTLTYQLQYQDSNAAFCIAATCGTSVIRNVISLGVGWHERPLLF